MARKKIAISILAAVAAIIVGGIIYQRFAGTSAPSSQVGSPAGQAETSAEISAQATKSSDEAALSAPADAAAGQSARLPAGPWGPRRGREPRMADTGQGQDFPRPQMPQAVGDTTEATEAVNLNNVEMRQVIEKLAEWTQKPVIPVNDEILQTRVTVYAPHKLTRSQALSLLVTALQARGVLVEQIEDRIMLRPLATVRLGTVPTLGVDEPLARIEDKSQVVEKWFQLSTYSPSRLVQIITPLIGSYGYAVADEKSRRVGVIETVDNLMRIERLIQQVDLPESEQEMEKIYQLRYADPAEVVGVLQLILGDREPRGGRGGVQGSPPSAPAAGGGSAPAGQSATSDAKTAVSIVVDSGAAVPVRMIPLAKQRWILVRASRDDIRRIDQWIERLDIEQAEPMHQSVVQVRFADVREVARMVQNTLQQLPGTDLKANIVVEPLVQTGQIVIYGNEANRTMVEKLIAQIDTPKEDLYIERTFKLKHADPDQIKKNIDQLYGDTAPTGLFFRQQFGGTARKPEEIVRTISYPMLKQVTVIAAPPLMDKIARQIEEEWDKPLDIEKDQYRIISLKNSDPVRLAELLKKLFSQEGGATGGQNFFRMLFFGDDAASRQKIVGSLYGMLTFEPVPDTKKLIVISQIPEAYEIIDRLVAKLDGREDAEVPKVITLKYADAEALCDQLNAILNEPGTPVTIPRSVRGLSAYDPSKSNQAVAGSEESSAAITPWWTRQRADSTKLPTSNLIGRVRFVPVYRSKAVLVLSPPEYLGDITKVIEELDKPGMQVMIKVVIVEINLSDSSSLGVKLASDPQAFGPLGVNAMRALNQLNYTDRRTNFSFVTDADINVLVDLLVKYANGRVLNQPTLWTKDNEEAIFVKGQKVAFIAGEQIANTGSTQRTFNFEDVGVTLRIRPNITPEKAVDLTINLNISQIQPELINGQNVRSNLDSTTRLIVSDGQSVMMGGILFQNDATLKHKLPLLGDIPLVGALFSHESKELTNNELLVFVTPYVIDETTLGAMPQDPTSRQQTLDTARQRLDATVDELNKMFLQP